MPTAETAQATGRKIESFFPQFFWFPILIFRPKNQRFLKACWAGSLAVGQALLGAVFGGEVIGIMNSLMTNTGKPTLSVLGALAGAICAVRQSSLDIAYILQDQRKLK